MKKRSLPKMNTSEKDENPLCQKNHQNKTPLDLWEVTTEESKETLNR